MCEKCRAIAEEERKSLGLPEGAPVPILYACPDPKYKPML